MLLDGLGVIVHARFGDVEKNLVSRDLVVEDANLSVLLSEELGDRDGRTRSRVARVLYALFARRQRSERKWAHLLEGKAEQGNLLGRDRIEERRNDTLAEPTLLKLVHLDDLTPVGCDLGQVKGFREVAGRENENSIVMKGAATRTPG